MTLYQEPKSVILDPDDPWRLVPEHLRGALWRYLAHRIPPGGFLTAVLENNLRESFGRADENSRAGLFNLVKFLYNHAPASCWGSPERVRTWLNPRSTDVQDAQGR